MGDVNAKPKKRDALLHPTIGVTDLNYGRDAFVTAVLKPFVVLIQRLQTVKQPVPHLLARWFRHFIRIIELQFINADNKFPAPYSTWRDLMMHPSIDKPKLVEALDKEAKKFATVLVKQLQKRLKPYWSVHVVQNPMPNTQCPSPSPPSISCLPVETPGASRYPLLFAIHVPPSMHPGISPQVVLRCF